MTAGRPSDPFATAAEPTWRTSSRSQTTNCVEVAVTGDACAVRDSKDRSGPVLTFARPQWRDFVAATKAGEFDLN